MSPKLTIERRLPLLGLLLFGLALLAFGRFVAEQSEAAGADLTGALFSGLAAAALVGAVVGWFFVVPRVVSAWRYAEREQDLLVSRGRLVR